MSNIADWAVSATENSDPPPDGAPENMARKAVNDTMREMMAATARWWQDRNGSLQTGGAGNAYTVTTNQGDTDPTKLGVIDVRMDRTNTGACTLAVNGGSALDWNGPNGNPLGAGVLEEDALVPIAYNVTTGAYESLGVSTFASGTKIVLPDTTVAPLGWTQSTIANDAILRIMSTPQSGTGGSNWVITGLAVQSHALSTGEMPSHDHPDNISISGSQSGGLTRNFDDDKRGVDGGGGSSVVQDVSYSDTTLSISGGVQNRGSGNTHNHGFTNPGTWRPPYVNTMIVVKN